MRAVLVVAMLIVGPFVVPTGVAHAGRTNYGWLYGDEVLPKRGVEVQTWVYERNGRLDGQLRETLMWWGALVGVTEQFELVFPSEWIWRDIDSVADSATFTLEKYGVEARYRFNKLDPESPDGISPLFRIALKRDVTARTVTIGEADLVVGYSKGRFHGQVDMGLTTRISEDETNLELRPGAGVAFKVKDDLRFGAEAYGEIFIDSDSAVKKQSWFGVGPNISWTYGRFWLSASFLIGVYQIETAPRLIWGILF